MTEFYEWFWLLMTIFIMAWYTFLTIYIAYRGVFDIQVMLKKLSSGNFDPDAPES